MKQLYKKAGESDCASRLFSACFILFRMGRFFVDKVYLHEDSMIITFYFIDDKQELSYKVCKRRNVWSVFLFFVIL